MSMLRESSSRCGSARQISSYFSGDDSAGRIGRCNRQRRLLRCRSRQANAQGKEEVAAVEDSTPSEEGEFFGAQQMPALQTSMHALYGTPTSATTFTLELLLGNQTAIALVDSGSDASFINGKFAVKSQTKTSVVSSVQVAAGLLLMANLWLVNLLVWIAGFLLHNSRTSISL